MRYSWFFTVCQPCTSHKVSQLRRKVEKTITWNKHLNSLWLPCSLCSSRTVMSLRWRFGRWPSIYQVVGRQAGGGWEADWLSPCAQVQGVVVHHALLKINHLRYWSCLIIWTIFLFRVKADLSSSQNYPMVFSYANDGCCFWSPVLETSVQLHPGNFTNGYKNVQDGLYKRFLSFQIWLVFGVSNVKFSGGGG